MRGDDYLFHLNSGCGIGTDTINFLRHGANLTSIDISGESVKIASERAKVYGFEDASIFQANIEQISTCPVFEKYSLKAYDLVYSFGVLHHTPDPKVAMNNIAALQEPGAELRLMLYSKISYKLMWAMYEKKMWKMSEANDIIREYAEAQTGCPVAYTYTFKEVEDLLSPWYSITSIKKDHIFKWNIEKYIEKEYVIDEAWDGVDEKAFKAWEEELGWHTLVKAVRN